MSIAKRGAVDESGKLADISSGESAETNCSCRLHPSALMKRAQIGGELFSQRHCGNWRI